MSLSIYYSSNSKAMRSTEEELDPWQMAYMAQSSRKSGVTRTQCSAQQALQLQDNSKDLLFPSYEKK